MFPRPIAFGLWSARKDGLSFSLRRRNEPLVEIYLSKIAADFFRKPPDVINNQEVTRYDSKRQYVWQNRMLSVTAPFSFVPWCSKMRSSARLTWVAREKGSLFHRLAFGLTDNSQCDEKLYGLLHCERHRRRRFPFLCSLPVIVIQPSAQALPALHWSRCVLRRLDWNDQRIA